MDYTFEGQPLTTLEYTIKTEEYITAFVAFQKKYVYPKNYILTAIFAAIAILYGNQIYVDPSYSIAWLLIGMCVLFVAQMWFNTYRVRKKLATSIKEIADDKYTTNVFENGLRISTVFGDVSESASTDTAVEAVPVQENTELAEKKPDYDDYDNYDNIVEEVPPKEIFFDRDKPNIISAEGMYIIYLKKRMFYVIPKRALSESDSTILSELFAKKS